MQDIDMASHPADDFPIGLGSAITGTFDGGGHAIRNLTIDADGADNVGLFSDFTGIIKRLALIDFHLTNGKAGGPIVGWFSGQLVDSYATGSITAEKVGGLVGKVSRSILTNTYSTVDVNATGEAGGILTGLSYVEHSFYAGDIAAVSGGPILSIDASSSVSDCFYDETRSCSGCDVLLGTAIDDPAYFYDTTNPPFDSWNFTTVWEAHEDGYPTLR